MTGGEPRYRADPRKWGPVAVVVAVVAANLAYLTGLRDPNPALQLSGLGSVSSGPILAGRNFIDPNVGFTAQALGHLAALDWLHGHVPWWNPFEGIGAPLAGEMQSAALFPLVLLDALPNGQVWFRLVLELLAGLSAYFLACRLVRSRWAATAVGVAFGLNGTFSWLFHAAANPVAFLPFLLLGVEQALDRRTRGLAGWPLIGLAVALSMYAGFPEVAFIDGLLAVVWFTVRASELVVPDLVVFLRRGAAGLLLGGALAAPVLVAFLTYLPSADTGNHGAGYAGQSLKAGLAAGIGGLILVMLYTIVYYRILGVVVVSGLALTAALLWAIISALGHSQGLTLDLAGVTGLIVSIGITVDSYIVYFERLKDEARAGRSVRTSVTRSFHGAFRTVLAADLVSLFAAAILYWLTVGSVKGFALFLGLSTILDVATTFFFTRPLVALLGRSRTVTEARVIGIARGLAVESGGQP